MYGRYDLTLHRSQLFSGVNVEKMEKKLGKETKKERIFQAWTSNALQTLE